MPDEIYTKSVMADEMAQVKDGAILRVMVPFMGGWNDTNRLNMPPYAPPYWSYQRDAVLRASIHQEPLWAGAVGIAITKMASLSWEIKSDVARRVKNYQEIFLQADGSRVGWCGFLAKHLRDFLTTDNGAFIEIVREKSTIGSKIIGIRHLDSLRCVRTGDPDIPVLYRDRLGRLHEMLDHQVITMADMPDSGDTYYGTGFCAASRAYKAIFKQASIEWYLGEKVSGLRPLNIYIVNGLISKQLEGAVQAAKEEAISKGISAYMGAVIVGTPSDTPPEVANIPLAELPDRFNRKEEFDIAILEYANALGLDPQELQPLSGQALGTGAQSQVLADKQRGKGLAYWRQDFTHAVNQYLLDDQTEFVFIEKDYRDQEAKASVSKARADIAKVRIDAQITSPAQELQLLVDQDELPKEFLPNDITPGTTASDTEKLDADEMKAPEEKIGTDQAQQTAGQIAAQEKEPQQEESETEKPAAVKPVDLRAKIDEVIKKRAVKEKAFTVTDPSETSIETAALMVKRTIDSAKKIVKKKKLVVV